MLGRNICLGLDRGPRLIHLRGCLLGNLLGMQRRVPYASVYSYEDDMHRMVHRDGKLKVNPECKE